MKLCSLVLGITLTITNITKFLHHVPLCWALFLGYFMAYFGTLYLLFENRSIFSHDILYRCSWCYSEGHCTIFSISWPCWEAVGAIFGVIFSNVPLILYNGSTFFHEILHSCSWSSLDGHYTKKWLLTSCPLFCWGPFLSICRLILAYVPLFLRAI